MSGAERQSSGGPVDKLLEGQDGDVPREEIHALSEAVMETQR
jgi:hypothetical protein